MSARAAEEAPAGQDVRGARPRAIEIALVLGVWVCLAGPQLVQALVLGRGFVPVTGGARESPPALELATTVGNGALVLGGAVLVALHVRALPWRSWPVLAALLAPWIASVGLLLAAGRPPGPPVLLYPVIATTAWAVRPRMAAVPVLGGVVAATATLSVLLGLLAGDRALYSGYAGADLDKSVGGWGILAGLLPSGNNLGLCLAVGLPAVLAVRGAWRWPAVAVTLVAIGWSFSRTAWLAVVVVVLATLAVRLVRRSWAPGAVLGGLGAVVVAVPWFVRSDSAFANRGGYWRESLDAWRESPLVGKGPDWFDELAATAQNLGGHAYHAHHQVVQALVTGGIVLTVLTLALFVLAAVRAARLARSGHAWGLQTLAALFAVSLLEVPFGSVDRAAFYPYVLVALCLVLLVPEPPERGGAGA